MRVVQMNPFSNAPRGYQNAAEAENINFPSESDKKDLRKFKIDFKNFKADDWILLGIIATLILEGSDDYILLCALGYLFIMGL